MKTLHAQSVCKIYSYSHNDIQAPLCMPHKRSPEAKNFFLGLWLGLVSERHFAMSTHGTNLILSL